MRFRLFEVMQVSNYRMKDIQVFITATDIDEDLRKKLPKGNTYFVDNGIVNIFHL